MFVDILMAFMFAMLLEWFYFVNKNFKYIVSFVACITIVLIYFLNDCKIEFAGTIDFSIWIIFVIMFDRLIRFAMNKLSKHIK